MNTETIATQPSSSNDNQVNWVTTFFMAAFHIGAIAALFFFTWKALLVAAVLWWVSGSLGIGMGYHRLLTHRGYKTPRWVDCRSSCGGFSFAPCSACTPPGS